MLMDNLPKKKLEIAKSLCDILEPTTVKFIDRSVNCSARKAAVFFALLCYHSDRHCKITEATVNTQIKQLMEAFFGARRVKMFRLDKYAQ